MKKTGIIIIILTIFFISCKKEENPEEIQNKIFEYKQKINELQKQLDNKTDNSGEHYVSVRINEVKKEKLTHYINATAYVKPKNSAFISPQTNGQISKIHVKEGQFVKKGQILVTLNASVLKSTMEEVKTGLELAEILYKKQKELYEKNIGKELDYLQAKNKKETLEAKLKTLKAQLALTVITAPISGIIDEIYLKEGEIAAPGRQVINLVNLSKLEAEADVSEKYVPYIKTGEPVTITFPAYPDFIVHTKISGTGNVINPVNRTFKVKAEFYNEKNKIKPNMVAELKFSDYSGKDIAVPSIAVKKDANGEYLFVAEKKDNEYLAIKKYIKTSYLIDDKIIVTQGINEGDKVIIEGYNLVTNNQKIKIK